MGTASYMSPEQARGKAVDKRTDIWAFGCCLFEALTGSKPFAGDNVTDILASVVRAEPDWNALPKTTAPHIRQLLRRCLTKDPRQRVRDIGDARLAMHPSGEPAEPTSMQPPPRHPAVGILWAGLAVVSAALAAVLVSVTMKTADEEPVITFPISSTATLRVVTGPTTPFAISRDGTTIVFNAVVPPATVRSLWVRSLHDRSPRALEGTDGGFQPALSPDGEWIAFMATNRTVKKVSVNGGPVTTLATLEYNSAALAWLSADELLAETLGPKGIQILSAHGGTPEVVIPLDTEASEFRQRRPFVLRDLRMVLYASTVGTGRTELAMFSLDDGRRARLGVEGIQALGIVDERLVYVRDDGVLMAVPFDAGRMQTTGAPVQLLEQVARSVYGVAVALSANGTLVYEAPRNRDSHLTLLDASGRTTLIGSDGRNFREPSFSPDDARIAVEVATGPGFDLWVYDRALTSPRRVTRSGNTSGHRWTPDGKSLLYAAPDDDGTLGSLWSLAVDGGTEPARIDSAGVWVREAEMTPDGNSLVVLRVEPHGENLAELVLVPLGGDAAPISLVAWPSWPRSVRVSPNGRLLAYVDRRPVDRVMVMTLDGETRVFVSDGRQPVWAPDSQSLFYRSDEQVIEAELTTSPTLELVRQTAVMEDVRDVSLWDVTSDGLAFLALTPVESGSGSEILVSVNWAAEKAREWRSR